jgi:hypothetical protein
MFPQDSSSEDDLEVPENRTNSEDVRYTADYRNEEDTERMGINQHQLNKVDDLRLREIAEKADRGEELTEDEIDR